MSGRDDAKQKIFTPDETYDGYQVRVGVKPRGTTPAVEGTEVYSNPVSIRMLAPSVTDVTISGRATVTYTLTANYSFQANGGAAESGTTFQWYLDGSPIANATGKDYTVLRNNPGKTLTVKVTPKNQNGVSGIGVTSSATAPVEPTILPRAAFYGPMCTLNPPPGGEVRWDMANVGDDVRLYASYGQELSAMADKGVISALPIVRGTVLDYQLYFKDSYGNTTNISRVKFTVPVLSTVACQAEMTANGTLTRWPD